MREGSACTWLGTSRQLAKGVHASPDNEAGAALAPEGRACGTWSEVFRKEKLLGHMHVQVTAAAHQLSEFYSPSRIRVAEHVTIPAGFVATHEYSPS